MSGILYAHNIIFPYIVAGVGIMGTLVIAQVVLDKMISTAQGPPLMDRLSGALSKFKRDLSRNLEKLLNRFKPKMKDLMVEQASVPAKSEAFAVEKKGLWQYDQAVITEKKERVTAAREKIVSERESR